MSVSFTTPRPRVTGFFQAETLRAHAVKVIAILVVTLAVAVAVFASVRKDPVELATFEVKSAAFVRKVNAEGNLKAVKAQPLSAPPSAPGALKIAWIADDGALVKKDDIIVRFDPTDFEKELLTGNEDHNTASNSIQKTDVTAAATRTNLRRDATQAQSELESASRFSFDDAEVFSRYQRIESETDQRLAGEKKAYAERVLGVRDGLTRTERELLEIDDRKASLKIRNAQQGLSSLEVRAPYDGILVLQRDWRGEVPRVGSNVWRGQVIGEIPEMSAMKAEVFVLEADAAGLAVGKTATVALESNRTVTYTGKVTQVDKLARPRVRGVPVQYFGVTITLDKTDTKVMKPGARVVATLEVENLQKAFAIPRQAMFEKEGKQLVYRKKGEKFEPVPVEIASSSAGRVVVTRGVADGDVLALVDPTLDSDEEEVKSNG